MRARYGRVAVVVQCGSRCVDMAARPSSSGVIGGLFVGGSLLVGLLRRPVSPALVATPNMGKVQIHAQTACIDLARQRAIGRRFR